MNDWNIQSRAHQCQACGKSFADKQVYHTLLLDEKQDYLRVDVCQACWQSQHSEGARDRKGFVSHWQGAYELPPAAAPDPIHKETAETLLRKLVTLNDPRFSAAAYILAVMLERKRLLKVREQIQSEGRRVFIYEHPRSGDVFTIPDPQLQLNQLEQVQRDVADLLEHGLPGPPPGDAVSSPEAAPPPGGTAPVPVDSTPAPRPAGGPSEATLPAAG
jgi:hypothetical protein